MKCDICHLMINVCILEVISFKSTLLPSQHPEPYCQNRCTEGRCDRTKSGWRVLVVLILKISLWKGIKWGPWKHSKKSFYKSNSGSISPLVNGVILSSFFDSIHSLRENQWAQFHNMKTPLHTGVALREEMLLGGAIFSSVVHLLVCFLVKKSQIFHWKHTNHLSS